jgi:DNA-3-methyladenine glycosylase I
MASETACAAGNGNDGLARCPWALGSDDYIAYHDEEWGRPVHGDAALYERLTLEGFQSGLSWLTILRKRPAFRRAFAGFDPDVVATFDDSDVERLMADSSIVRNRRKIESTVSNARALVALRMNEGDGALDRLIWSYAADGAAPETVDDVPAQTADSKALAKALKRYDFGFVGPTTCYAAMQACGVVNDHLAGCAFRH